MHHEARAPVDEHRDGDRLELAVCLVGLELVQGPVPLEAASSAGSSQPLRVEPGAVIPEQGQAPLDRLAGGFEGAPDLPQGGLGDQVLEDSAGEVQFPETVVEPEGLGGEPAPAAQALEALDSPAIDFPPKEAASSPGEWCAPVMNAVVVGTVLGLEGLGRTSSWTWAGRGSIPRQVNDGRLRRWSRTLTKCEANQGGQCRRPAMILKSGIAENRVPTDSTANPESRIRRSIW